MLGLSGATLCPVAVASVCLLGTADAGFDGCFCCRMGLVALQGPTGAG